MRYAWWALALLVVVGLVGGWLLAGRCCAPRSHHRRRTPRRRRIARPPHRSCPDAGDELTDLADAFDAMLDRVQLTLDEERRFAANASHELRTPHAIIRTMVEVAQADPDGRDVDVLLQRIAATNDRAIATTEALLALARAGRGAAPREPSRRSRADRRRVRSRSRRMPAASGIRIETALDPASVTGDRRARRTARRQSLRNAVVHNVAGRADPRLGTGRGARAELR